MANILGFILVNVGQLSPVEVTTRLVGRTAIHETNQMRFFATKQSQDSFLSWLGSNLAGDRYTVDQTGTNVETGNYQVALWFADVADMVKCDAANVSLYLP